MLFLYRLFMPGLGTVPAFLCKAEAADGCGTLSCGLFVAVMSRCFAGTKQDGWGGVTAQQVVSLNENPQGRCY